MQIEMDAHTLQEQREERAERFNFWEIEKKTLREMDEAERKE